MVGSALGITLSTTAFAQAGPDAGALQQQLQREIERERPASPPEQLIKPKQQPTRPKAGLKAIDVKAFKVTGITLITQEQAQEALKPFVNRQLTLDQIKDAGSAVSNLYSQIGRVAQAIIPPQDVLDGVIEIKIIEGKVGEVIIQLNQTAPSRLHPDLIQKFITQSNMPGELIDLIGLERSLALLNETQSINC